MDEVHLAKRHGTHLHAHTVNWFALAAFVLLVIYSIISFASTQLGPFRRLRGILASSYVCIAVWAVLVSWAIFHHFNADMLQIARRYGQLAIGSATVSVFLSFKPAILPYTYAVPLILLHKWTGRTSVALSFFHGVLYLYAYIKKPENHSTEGAAETESHSEGMESHTEGTDSHSEGTEAVHEAARSLVDLVKRHGGHLHPLFSLYNVFGMIALAAMLIIFFSSLSPVRRRAYFLFYALHRPLAILIYVLMIWHTRPSAWVMVSFGLVMLAVQVVAHWAFSRTVTITRVEPIGPSLRLVEFDPPVKQVNAGCHIRIAANWMNPFKPSHPYTLAGTNRLVVRESRFKFVEGSTMSLYGPFKPSLDLSQYTHFLVFAGGSGVSILPSFVTAVDPENWLLVWVLRTNVELPVLEKLEVLDCAVYITNSQLNEDDDGFEMQEIAVDDEEEEMGALLGGPEMKGIQKFVGRPNFSKVSDQFISKADRVCVVACGPESLVNDVHSWARSKSLDTWTEVFSL